MFMAPAVKEKMPVLIKFKNGTNTTYSK